jgi:hypothetical protein
MSQQQADFYDAVQAAHKAGYVRCSRCGDWEPVERMELTGYDADGEPLYVCAVCAYLYL